MKKPQETAPRHPLCHGPVQSRPIAPPFRSLISSRHFATFSLSSSSQFRFSRPNLRSRCLILSISGGNLRERVTQRQALQFRIGEVVYNLIEINLKMLFCKLRFFFSFYVVWNCIFRWCNRLTIRCFDIRIGKRNSFERIISISLTKHLSMEIYYPRGGGWKSWSSIRTRVFNELKFTRRS